MRRQGSIAIQPSRWVRFSFPVLSARLVPGSLLRDDVPQTAGGYHDSVIVCAIPSGAHLNDDVGCSSEVGPALAAMDHACNWPRPSCELCETPRGVAGLAAIDNHPTRSNYGVRSTEYTDYFEGICRSRYSEVTISTLSSSGTLLRGIQHVRMTWYWIRTSYGHKNRDMITECSAQLLLSWMLLL